MRSIRHLVVLGLVLGLGCTSMYAANRLDLKGDADESKQAGNADKPNDEQGSAKRTPQRANSRANAAPRAAQSRPTNTRRARKVVKIPPSANAVIQELKGEFERGKLRTKSEYLKDEPKAELTGDVIVAMLARRYGSSDAMDAYVKWQLLSGLSEKVPEDMVSEAIAAYRNAPALEWRPGITPDQKKALDREIKRVDDPSDLAAMLIDEARRVMVLNEPVIQYREELFSKLPNSLAVFQAALLDIYERGEAGMSPRKFLDVVSRRIIEWSANAPEDELWDMSQMLDDLLAVEMPSYYEGVRSGANGASWDNRRINLNENDRLADLADTIGRKAGR